jgi:hypothetical protein
LTTYAHLFDVDLDALADGLDARPRNLAAHTPHGQDDSENDPGEYLA